jgi:hypothetical protein
MDFCCSNIIGHLLLQRPPPTTLVGVFSPFCSFSTTTISGSASFRIHRQTTIEISAIDIMKKPTTTTTCKYRSAATSWHEAHFFFCGGGRSWSPEVQRDAEMVIEQDGEREREKIEMQNFNEKEREKKLH